MLTGVRQIFRCASYACVLISLSAASLLSFARTGQSLSAADLSRQASTAVLAGNFEVALEEYRAAEQAAPGNITLRLRTAALLARMQRLPEAIAEYREATRLDPKSEPTAVGLADVYRKVFNYDEARRILRASAKAHPHSLLSLVSLGELDIQLQKYDEAIAELKRALAVRPGHAAAHRDLGICYRAKGQSGRALAEFNAALRADPKDPSSYYFRGALYADRNENEKAAADARKVLALQPGNAPGTVLLGKLLLRAGRCAEAASLLASLRTSQPPDTEALFQLARAYECAGQTDKAKAVRDDFARQAGGEEGTRTGKADADHLADRAAELARSNQLQPALDFLDQALKKDPQNGAAHAQLAKIQFSAGNVLKAREEIESALRSNPYHPEYLYVLGMVLEKQSDDAGALEAFNRAVLVDPREADAYYEMAKIYARTGNRTRARQAIQNALQILPGDPDYKRAWDQLSR